MRRSALFLTLPLVGWSQGAHADEPSLYGTGRWAIELVGGLGTPAGAVGLAGTYDVLDWLEVTGFGGVGAFGDPQIGTMARVLLPGQTPGGALGFGVGLAYGGTTVCLATHCTGPIPPGPWLTAELASETRSVSGLRFRLSTGLVARKSGAWGNDWGIVPYPGLAVGWGAGREGGVDRPADLDAKRSPFRSEEPGGPGALGGP